MSTTMKKSLLFELLLKIRPVLKRLSVVDYLFLLLAVSAVGFALFFFSRKGTDIFVEMTYERNSDREFPVPPEYWAVNGIKTGDIVYNNLGQTVAQVVDTERIYWGSDRNYFKLVIKARGIFNNYNKTYTIDGRPALINQKLSLNIGKTMFTGVISDIYSNPSEKDARYARKNITVTLVGRGYDEKNAEAVRGMVVKNSKGETKAIAQEVKIQPAEIMVTTNDGRAVKALHPFNKDVTAVFTLYGTECDLADCYYENFKPIKIGQLLWINSDLATFSGLIVDIKFSGLQPSER